MSRINKDKADEGEEEEEEEEEKLGPAKKKRNMASWSDLTEKEFTLMNILIMIENVTNWKELGTQLGVKSSRLSTIEEEEGSEVNRKIKMIEEWMKMEGEKANWGTLQDALTTPALCENAAAQMIAKRRGSSFDSKSVLWNQSIASDCSDGEFTEAKVRNRIEYFPHIHELGEKLGIPTGKLEEIAKLAPDKRKLKFVEILFRVDPDCNWTRLKVAMKEVDIMLWAKKTKEHSWQKAGSGSFGSFSDEMFSPTHCSSASVVSDLDQTELLAPRAASKKNEAIIKKNYAKLIMKIAKNLKKAKPDMDDFHTFVINIFDASELPKVETVQDIFKILSEKKCWSFIDVSNLESIVEEFSEGLEDQNKKLIKQYKEELSGFKAATKIVNFMNSKREKETDEGSDGEEYISIDSDKAKYDEKYRKRLSIKLNDGIGGTKITLQSLEYVEKLWNSLCEEFEMPSLPKLLDSIMSGSIIVTWIVRRIHAQKILHNIFHAAVFLKRELVVGVYLEGVCIYDDVSGVATTEVINYTRLLMMEQEEKLQQEISILESCFPDINATINQEGRSLVTMAAQCGQKGLLEFLLDHGADAYQIDSGGKDVLSISATHEDINIWLKTVLEDKMISSAKDGDSATVKKALEFGIDPDAKERDEYAWNALLWSCENGHQEVVDYLLKHGAAPDTEDKSSWTGLILATRNGYLEIVKKMLDKGANPNKITSLCWTPLMWTAEGNYPEIAKLLLEKGADPNIHDRAGLSPLFQAAFVGHLDVVRVLVENSKELNINHTTELDWSALAVAVKNGHEDIVNYLVKHDADTSYVKRDGTTVLHIACCKGHDSIARFLCVQKRVNVNVKDMDGLTPLMFAASQGKLSLVRLLVENGRADLNLDENMNNWTAVFFAMQAEHQQVMEYLLSTKRIDMAHKDREGSTLFDLAEKLNPKAFQYLENNFKQDMALVEKRRIETGESKPSFVKTLIETGEMYFVPMLRNLQTKTDTSIKAGAGAA